MTEQVNLRLSLPPNRTLDRGFRTAAEARKLGYEVGVVSTAHEDGTYDVQVGNRPYPWRKLMTTDMESRLEVGDEVVIGFLHNNRQLPFILCLSPWLSAGTTSVQPDPGPPPAPGWERYQKDMRLRHYADALDVDVVAGVVRHLAWDVAGQFCLVTQPSQIWSARAGFGGKITRCELDAAGYEDVEKPSPWPPTSDYWTDSAAAPIGTAETFHLCYRGPTESAPDLLVCLSHFLTSTCFPEGEGEGGGEEEGGGEGEGEGEGGGG